jgi:hypothetical protein
MQLIVHKRVLLVASTTEDIGGDRLTYLGNMILFTLHFFCDRALKMSSGLSAKGVESRW